MNESGTDAGDGLFSGVFPTFVPIEEEMKENLPKFSKKRFLHSSDIQNQLIEILKCHCNEKIFDPILNTTEQHF